MSKSKKKSGEAVPVPGSKTNGATTLLETADEPEQDVFGLREKARKRKELRFSKLPLPDQTPVRWSMEEHPGGFRTYRNIKRPASASAMSSFRVRCPEWTIDENRGPWHALTLHQGTQMHNRYASPFYRPKFLRGVALDHLCGDNRGARSHTARRIRRPRRYLPAGPDFYSAGIGCARKENFTIRSSISGSAQSRPATAPADSNTAATATAAASPVVHVNRDERYARARDARKQQRTLEKWRQNITGVDILLRKPPGRPRTAENPARAGCGLT
ncbi:unnamed protein product [Amoebophrya sp. A120]|nr:unnamed protein product [Amoebophrya sp. A120]|eukprot:GSA120T00002611001.1